MVNKMKIKDKLVVAVFVIFFCGGGYIIGASKTEIDCIEQNVEVEKEKPRDNIVYVTPTGKRYHFSITCAGKNATETTMAQAAKTKGLLFSNPFVFV